MPAAAAAAAGLQREQSQPLPLPQKHGHSQALAAAAAVDQLPQELLLLPLMVQATVRLAGGQPLLLAMLATQLLR
jgi:hypothetical protein